METANVPMATTDGNRRRRRHNEAVITSSHRHGQVEDTRRRHKRSATIDRTKKTAQRSRHNHRHRDRHRHRHRHGQGEDRRRSTIDPGEESRSIHEKAPTRRFVPYDEERQAT